MEIITILLSAYKFGRALLNGGSLDSAAGDLLTAFLRPLLAGQDETIRALDRIEATLGRMETQRYHQGLSVGWECLRDATAVHRTSDERMHLLRTAQHEFRTAAATAPDGPSAVTAKLLVAACWIARGYREDALGSLADAAFRALEDVYDNAHEYAQPSNALEVWGKSEGTASRLRRNLIDGGLVAYDNPALASTRAQLRADARARRDEAADLYNQVQQVRSAYCENDAGCAPVVGFYEPGEDVLSPRRPAEGLRTSVFINNSPVLSWTPGQAIDLLGVRLELTNSPSVSHTDTGHRVDFGISAVLSESEVTLSVSPCWPYDHNPNPISSDTVVGRSLVPFGLFWSGAKMRVAKNHDFRFASHTTRRPERIVAKQSDIVIAGRRNFLLAALDL